jgi:hypothetical protein
MSTKTHYIPGVCNINPQEIKQRRYTGHLGLAVTIVLIVLVFALHVSWYLRVIVIIPAFLMAIGYLQAYNKFCVSYAAAKQHHADDGEVIEITDKEMLALDRKKTRMMNLQATIIAALIAAIVCVVPV